MYFWVVVWMDLAWRQGRDNRENRFSVGGMMVTLFVPLTMLLVPPTPAILYPSMEQLCPQARKLKAEIEQRREPPRFGLLAGAALLRIFHRFQLV